MIMWSFRLGVKTAFRVSVTIFNSNCHTKKAVYVTLKSFKYEPEWAQFTRVGQTITLHHSEMMRLILDYNNHIDMKAVVSEEVATAESGEEEDRPLAVMKPPITKKKASPIKKTPAKKVKQTITESPTSSSITPTEEITIESD